MKKFYCLYLALFLSATVVYAKKTKTNEKTAYDIITSAIIKNFRVRTQYPTTDLDLYRTSTTGLFKIVEHTQKVSAILKKSPQRAVSYKRLKKEHKKLEAKLKENDKIPDSDRQVRYILIDEYVHGNWIVESYIHKLKIIQQKIFLILFIERAASVEKELKYTDKRLQKTYQKYLIKTP